MNDERRGERVPGERPGDPSGRAGAMPRVADRRPGPPPPVRGPDGRPYPGPPPGGAPRPPGPNGPPGPRPGPGGPGGPGRGPGGPGPAPYGAPTHDQRPPEPPRSPAPEATTRSVAHAPTRAATAVAPAVALRDRAEGTGRGAGSGPRGPRGPRDDDAGARPPGKRRWRRVRRLIYLAVALLVLGPVLAFVIGWIFFRVPTADEATNNQVATIAYADGSRMAGLAQEQGNRIKVPITQVPVHVQQAVLAAEDRSFYSNYGFDPVGIARAAWNQARGGSGGGSTITQQYVKNVLVGDEYSLWRKYREVVIAAKISQEQSKEEILGNYLNSIYFGRGAYGIQAASQSYFGRDVATLSPSEGAMLAGLIQSPSKWDPAVDKGGSIQRWNFVLDGMVAQKWLAPNARAGAVFPTTVPPSSRSTGVPTNDRGHIVTAVREELAQYGITEQQVNQEGLQITTTIDPRLQQEAVDAAAKALKGQPQNLRTALVSTDPKTGAIRAYYGGTDGSGFDYAQTQRQPGSSFKPFVLLAGLQRDPPIGLGTRFDGSTPQTIAGKVVTNSEGESCPNCDLKAAMTQSINTVFYQLGVQVGPQSVADAAHQAGVAAPLPNPSGGISLGDKEVRPGDMSSAYATFAAEGVYHRPHMVSRVTAADGRVLYDSGAPEGEQRMSAQLARNVVESMTDVASHSKIALSGGRPVASKTGTVQSSTEGQNNDAWMVGFTPSVSTAVWVGTDDNTPIKTSAGRPIYGRGVPGQIWQSFMNDALRGTPTEKFGDYEPIGSAPAPASDSASPSTSPSGQPGGPQYCVDGTCVPLGTDGFPFGNGSGDSGSSGSGQNGSGENGSGNGSSGNGSNGNGSNGNGSNGNGSNGNGSGGNGSGGSGSGSGSSSDSGSDGDRDLGGLFARRPG